MNAIILTGGRGKRLGALTKSQPKANLRFAGRSLLVHTLSALKKSGDFITHVHIAVSYRAEKIERYYWHDIADIVSGIPVTFLPIEPEPHGTFGSVVWALRAAPTIQDSLILGVDVILTQQAMTRFVTSIHIGANTTFIVSPILAIAPTHGRIRLNDNGEIGEYRKGPFRPPEAFWDDWYCDVGVRYFSAEFTKECRLLSFAGACDFDDVMPSMVNSGRVFSSYILNERWLHFAHGRDFLQNPL